MVGPGNGWLAGPGWLVGWPWPVGWLQLAGWWVGRWHCRSAGWPWPLDNSRLVMAAWPWPVGQPAMAVGCSRFAMLVGTGWLVGLVLQPVSQFASINQPVPLVPNPQGPQLHSLHMLSPPTLSMIPWVHRAWTMLLYHLSLIAIGSAGSAAALTLPTSHPSGCGPSCCVLSELAFCGAPTF